MTEPCEGPNELPNDGTRDAFRDWILASTGDPDRAGWKEFVPAYFRDRLSELESVNEGEDPDDPERRAKIAALYSEMADFEYDDGAHEAAERSCVIAIRIWEKLGHDNFAFGDYRRDCAKAYHNLGLLKMETEHYESAAVWFRKASELLEQIVCEQPAAHEHSHALAGTIKNLGLANEQLGQLCQAWTQFSRSFEIWRQLAREHPSVEEYQTDYLKSRLNIDQFRFCFGRRRLLRRIGVGLIAMSICLVVAWFAAAWFAVRASDWLFWLWLTLTVGSVIVGAIVYSFGFVKDDCGDVCLLDLE